MNILLLFAGYFPPHNGTMRFASSVQPQKGRIVSGLLMMLGLTSPSPTAAIETGPPQNRITPGCDFYQNVEPGDKFYVYSPNYPNSFAPYVACRW